MPTQFGLFAKKMTETSRHYLNWTHLGMAMAAAATGFLGAHLNEQESTGCSDLTVGLISALVGSGLSNLAAHIRKRNEMQQNCIHLFVTINLNLANREQALSSQSNKNVLATLDTILKLTASEDNLAHPTQALEKRKTLLTKLQEHLDNPRLEDSYWQVSPADIIKALSDEPVMDMIQLKP